MQEALTCLLTALELLDAHEQFAAAAQLDHVIQQVQAILLAPPGSV
jgi:phage baseplate assembly protein W